MASSNSIALSSISPVNFSIFDRIQTLGDISPTIVAQGMKVALITTIFGIVVALILQLFYSYIISKIEKLTGDMEESAIELLDAIQEFKVKS